MHCHHPACDCNTVSVERSGKNYCSDACATGVALTKSLQEDQCNCAHAGCGETVEIPLSERPTVEMRAPGSISPRDVDPEGPGLKSDGMVGDTRQRAAESPGHQGPPVRSKLQAAGAESQRAGIRRNEGARMEASGGGDR